MSFSSAPGCLMCDSLYIKANGELPCWDDAGEEKILRALDLDALAKGEEKELALLDSFTLDSALKPKASSLSRSLDQPWAQEHLLKRTTLPGLVSGLANLYLLRGDCQRAELFFRRYLELAPSAADGARVERALLRLVVGNHLGHGLKQAEEAAQAVDPTCALDNRRIANAEAALLAIDPGTHEPLRQCLSTAYPRILTPQAAWKSTKSRPSAATRWPS